MPRRLRGVRVKGWARDYSYTPFVSFNNLIIISSLSLSKFVYTYHRVNFYLM